MSRFILYGFLVVKEDKFKATKKFARKIISGLKARVRAAKNDLNELDCFYDFMHNKGYLNKEWPDLVYDVVDDEVYTWYTGRVRHEENPSDCEGYENEVLNGVIDRARKKYSDRNSKIREDLVCAMKIKYCKAKQDPDQLAVFMADVNNLDTGDQIRYWAREGIRDWFHEVQDDERDKEVERLLVDEDARGIKFGEAVFELEEADDFDDSDDFNDSDDSDDFNDSDDSDEVSAAAGEVSAAAE